MSRRTDTFVHYFSSNDIEAASERLDAISGKSLTLDHFGRPDRFLMSMTTALLGRSTLTKVKLRAVRTNRPGDDEVHVSIPIGGTAVRYRCGSSTHDIGLGDPAAVVRPFDVIGVSAEEAFMVHFRAPLGALLERAEQLTLGSLRISADSQIAARVDLRTSSGRALERAMKAAIAEIGLLESSGLASVANAGYDDLLISHAAAALFPGVAARLGRPSAQVAPAVIQRAREYIPDHAAEPIYISTLAADLGIPMRTLQDNFRRYFGLSPQAWQRECRLEGAQQALRLPDAATTVTAVAEMCGFGNLGDFSVQYRQKYGESPSETLRLARKRLS